jgi:Sulfotransferase family
MGAGSMVTAHRNLAEGSIRYAYVLGTGYSGTTLLSLLLDSHPRIVSIGEVDNIVANFPPPYPCSCGRMIGECPFFTQVKELCAREGVEIDLQNFQVKLGSGLGRNMRRLLFGSAFSSALELGWLPPVRDALLGRLPIYRQHVKQVFDRNASIARASLKVSNKELFVDSSKTVARIPHLLRRPEIDVRIIHIVRDVRAVAWSALKRESQRVPAESTARYWVRTHEAALRLGALVGKERYFRFRWEDFCTAPEPVLDRICEFLGVEPVDLVSRVNAETHHVIGNDIRLRPVRPIRSDETWREVLEPSQRAAAERRAGELSRSFGYA